MWGNFAHFVANTEQLTSIVPQFLGPAMAWIATVAEIVLALALPVGWQTRQAGVLERFAADAFRASHDGRTRNQSPARRLRFSAATSAFLLSRLDHYKLSLDGRKSETTSR